MIKAVILDDEYLVIEAMRSLVNWEKFGIIIAGTAMDGVSGFDLIVKEEPQIVLTDIRMPGMDGLSIIEKARHIYPGMQFILFSGYTDFEYAKRAIVLGVLDYIVKPITAVKVEEVLQKAMRGLGITKETIKTKQEIQKSLAAGAEVSSESWKRAEVPISIGDIRECLILVCSVPKQNAHAAEFLEGNKDLKKYGVFYCAYTNMQMIMCLSTGVNGKEKMLHALSGAITIWKQDYEEVYIGLSYAKIVQTGIPAVFEQAKGAMSYGLFIGEQQMVDYQTMQMNKRLPLNIQKYEKDLLEGMKENQITLIEQTIQNFMDECRRMKTEPNMVKHFILEFVYSALGLKRELQNGKGSIHVYDEYTCPPHIYVNRCSNYMELSKWFREEILRITWDISKKRGTGKNRAEIQSVKQYIRTYYQKDLTLFELAELARMTPSYFSNVFKQEVGMTYIKYLTRVRIERAKELLDKGYKVFEVSREVGYENYRYFCVIFKKYTGVTAQQYRGSVKSIQSS